MSNSPQRAIVYTEEMKVSNVEAEQTGECSYVRLRELVTQEKALGPTQQS